MPSTYTPSLRLNKQATGENINTWGGTLNNGVIQLIDTAIAGVTVVPVSSSDVSLTTANGTTDESRAAVLSIQGALSNNVNVIIPNLTKTYDVWNGTSGGFTVGIKTSSGVAVTVTQGETTRVWCDGSNVVRKVGADSTAVAEEVVEEHNDDPAAHYPASETQRGFVELATAAEGAAGTDTERAIVPAILKSAVLSIFFPIGTVYITEDSGFNPNISWGGTWVAHGPGRVIVGYDATQTEFDTAGETGGAKTVALTAANNGPHGHFVFNDIDDTSGNVTATQSANRARTSGSTDVEYAIQGTEIDATIGLTSESGSGTPHNNLQPYIVCFRWKRTA